MHSTVSDGKLSPEEIKKLYMDNGYSIVAFTDHNIFANHSHLNDEKFLAINGVEIDIGKFTGVWEKSKTCHMCFLAMNPEIDAHPLWDESMEVDRSKAEFERIYTPEYLSNVMKTGREKGFFVTYNHPRWSLETYDQYINYHNMNAMEIYNHSNILGGFLDYNGVVYDEMLRAGKKIYALATDDSHNAKSSCGGYVVIKAERLEYEIIMRALEKGDFYSSTGPEIKSLWYDSEKNTVHIKTTNAKKIICSTGARCQHLASAGDKNCDYITEAEFPIKGFEDYIRITVLDENGCFADTNAYFLEDFLDN